MILKNVRLKSQYGILGVFLGIGAPLTWLVIEVLFFHESEHRSFLQQFIDTITSSSENIALYLFMGLGTSAVMGTLGYFIGKTADELAERAVELDMLHREVNEQKDLFENRYKILDNNIKNFHQISSRMQKSMEVAEVLNLCAEGLHDVLGYERVNILTIDESKENLRFFISSGTNEDVRQYTIPLDDRGGVIFKCFSENRLFHVDDMAKFPEEFHLKPPCSDIKALRSNSFILCPLSVKGKPIGVFGIDNKLSKRALNDTDVDTVRLFADQASSAITRINLLRAIDTLVSELDRSFAEILSQKDVSSTNIMTLGNAVSSMSSSTSEIASASEDVLHAVDETNTAVKNISLAIDHVATNLDSLTDMTIKSSSAMEQISASLKSIEQSAALSHKVSMQVKSEADEGRAVLSETAEALDEIQKAVDYSHLGILRLSENSSRIDNIVSVINDITKRTNLLALNASIIAAQAGEYGKSFGVVADEIRNLSLQTGQSTGEITTIIDEILHEARAAAENIAQTKNLVKKGVDLGNNTVDSLNTIIQSANRSMDMTEAIRIATTEQAQGVDIVVHAIGDISSMTANISRVSKEQSLATKSISSSIMTVRKMTNEMVSATLEQVRGGKEIRNSVDKVALMIQKIFKDIEGRRLESASVVKEMEGMKDRSKMSKL